MGRSRFHSLANTSPVGDRLRDFRPRWRGRANATCKRTCVPRIKIKTLLTGIVISGQYGQLLGLPRLELIRGDIDFSSTINGQVRILAQGRATAAA
jgi:hypothetical protein